MALRQYYSRTMTSTLGQQIGFYLKKALDINVNIGGKTAYMSLDKSKDKFTALKEEVSKGFHYIKEKIAEKEKKSARAEHIRIDNEVQNRVAEIETLLERMNEHLKRNAKAATEKNLRAYELLRSQVLTLKEILSGGAPSERLPGNGDLSVNFSDVRQQLLESPPPKRKEKESTRVRKERAGEASAIEMNQMESWKRRDEEIDDMLVGVISKVDELKEKAKLMGTALDTTLLQISQLDKEVDLVNDGLVSANQDLKGIVEKYKKPARCCLDIALTLVLIGLIVGIIKFAKD